MREILGQQDVELFFNENVSCLKKKYTKSNFSRQSLASHWTDCHRRDKRQGEIQPLAKLKTCRCRDSYIEQTHRPSLAVGQLQPALITQYFILTGSAITLLMYTCTFYWPVGRESLYLRQTPECNLRTHPWRPKWQLQLSISWSVRWKHSVKTRPENIDNDMWMA